MCVVMRYPRGKQPQLIARSPFPVAYHSVAELSLQRAACELCFEAHTRTTREVPSHFVATCAASAIATLREFEALYAAKCAELDALETRHEALQEEHQVRRHVSLRAEFACAVVRKQTQWLAPRHIALPPAEPSCQSAGAEDHRAKLAR